MATDQEVIDARTQIEDNSDLSDALAVLAAIFAGSEPIDLLIKRGDDTFHLSRLKAVLGSGNANEVAMIAALESSILNSVGETDVIAGSLRKAINDLIVQHDADITAT
jgi:hypothetical protein